MVQIPDTHCAVKSDGKKDQNKWTLFKISSYSLIKNDSSKRAHIVPAPEIKEICRLHNKIYKGYDCFDRWTTTIYSGTAINSGMKDRFIYHNRYLTIKILNQTAFFEKCACLLSAFILNNTSRLNFKILKRYLKVDIRFDLGTSYTLCPNQFQPKYCDRPKR